MSKTSTKPARFNHEKNCPCKGKAQPVSKRLAGRIAGGTFGSDNRGNFFRKPGSQNRKK